MAQWINLLQNNGFVNPLWSPFCGTIALVQLGLTRLADEMLVHLGIFKIICWTKHQKFIHIQKGTL